MQLRNAGRKLQGLLTPPEEDAEEDWEPEEQEKDRCRREEDDEECEERTGRAPQLNLTAVAPLPSGVPCTWPAGQSVFLWRSESPRRVPASHMEVKVVPASDRRC